ncbi:MAG: hypothetical protein WCD42_01605 [Rhizomicrobium sp.]
MSLAEGLALFGPGIAWASRTDISPATPFNVGLCNEFSVDASFDTDELYGQYQVPLLVGRTKMKVTGKISPALLSGGAMSTFLLGQSFTRGSQHDATTLTEEIPEAASYTVTPMVPSSGTFLSDLGVIDLESNQAMQKAASAAALTAGEYSVDESTGIYSFAAEDAGDSISISFSYSYTSSSSQTATWNNQLLGTTPTFRLDYKTVFDGQTFYIRLFKCTASKTSLGFKLDKFNLPEYDFSVMDNGAHQIGIISLQTLA